MRARRSVCALSVVLASCALSTSLGAAGAPPARAEALRVPLTSKVSAGTTGEVRVSVPKGVTPTRLRARISLSEPGGVVRLTVGGRALGTFPGVPTRRVALPLTGSDVAADRTITLSYVWSGPAAGRCVTDPPEVTVDRLVLGYLGDPQPATDVGEFFPAQVSRVDVVMPARPDDDDTRAALAAVAALSVRYPDSTPVSLIPANRPVPSAGQGQRVVRLEQPPEPTSSVIITLGADPNQPTMTIRGSGDPLIEAVRSLGPTAESTGPDEVVVRPSRPAEPVLTQSLEELGEPEISWKGWGGRSADLTVLQDSFGGAVSSYTLHLEGVRTALPAGAQARLDVYADGALADSTSLTGDDTDVSLDVDLSGDALRSVSTVRLVLTTIPASGTCDQATAQLPFELRLDPVRSTISATLHDTTPTTLQSFPSGLRGDLAMAIRTRGPGRTSAIVDAAHLVSALQRAAAYPLAIRVVSADELVESDTGGVLVGASAQDAVALRAPLLFGASRLVDLIGADARTRAGQPYAALEAVSHNGRSVLMLGAWSANGQGTEGMTRTLAVHAQSAGWASLRDDVLVATGDGAPVAVRSNAVPTNDADDEPGNRFVLIFVLVICVLLLVLAVQLFLTVRRDRALRAAARADDPADGPADDDGHTPS